MVCLVSVGSVCLGKKGGKKTPKPKGKTLGEKRGQGVYFVKLLV
jgi:hypothetical protein